MITLIPIGEIDRTILETLGVRLPAIFGQPTQMADGIPFPKRVWNPRRQQYLSTRILTNLPKSIGPHRVLGVADVDLYAVGYDFVFGEAELNKDRRAVISVHRLRPEYYGKRRNQRRFEERILKEAVHELGHTYGLGHCANQQCVMHFSTSVDETDAKSADFCPACRRKPGTRKALRVRNGNAQ